MGGACTPTFRLQVLLTASADWPACRDAVSLATRVQRLPKWAGGWAKSRRHAPAQPEARVRQAQRLLRDIRSAGLRQLHGIEHPCRPLPPWVAAAGRRVAAANRGFARARTARLPPRCARRELPANKKTPAEAGGR